jgi:methylmalonyl-CoA mutase
MGLSGMIDDLLDRADFSTLDGLTFDPGRLDRREPQTIAQFISLAENRPAEYSRYAPEINRRADESAAPVLGITGTGGAGKSSLIDEIIHRLLADFADKTVAIISIDPTKRKTGGALLGDRIRMNAIDNQRVFMRSLATRQSHLALSGHSKDALNIVKAAGFDLVLVETSGIGQSNTEIVDLSDLSLYVMTPEFGAATQLEKIDMLDFADIIAVNKFDKRGAQDALRKVKKQVQRARTRFSEDVDGMPAYGTIAAQFNDPGVADFYRALLGLLNRQVPGGFVLNQKREKAPSPQIIIIPPDRTAYLSEISQTIRAYNQTARQQAGVAQAAYSVRNTIETIHTAENLPDRGALLAPLESVYAATLAKLEAPNRKHLEEWEQKKQAYKNDFFSYQVRGREIKVQTFTESLSHLRLSRVALPAYRAWGDILQWILQENVPGEFPYTAGVFPFKRENEDPARMFAGEGCPERTNKRFHYLSRGLPAIRLSTAFDSVTLYGQDPQRNPDIYGKIGNAGVSVCCLDDVKKLFSGFNLADAKTSVSMTINGPAPVLAAFFMNAAIDQQCERYIRQTGRVAEAEGVRDRIFRDKGLPRPEYSGGLPDGNNGLGLLLLGVTGDQVLPAEIYQKIKQETLASVRGTIQTDILKEDQAQNTCIYSLDFALKLMGDMEEYFIRNAILNFYSVSISGYHIAEAGANPVTQLAFTLANGFTYVEYYRSRGMDLDHFAPNLSFFFSNGTDPEFSVIGRVARRIWAKAMKFKYGANVRSQALKYHIQTSGRSLHAQEIDFNDIRTTLQALYAIYDNCNSLHTNAYDEAITTPTEESARRALAIQLIISKELGLAKNENPLQGSFIIEEMTDLVEEAVLAEFDRLTDRGGVTGAMETMYQRSKIQDESLYYETLKHDGKYPIVGVNTFLSEPSPQPPAAAEVIRATDEEKQWQLETLKQLHRAQEKEAAGPLLALQEAAVSNQNIFERLMETSKFCSLGQITSTLYQVGGKYRRNM